MFYKNHSQLIEFICKLQVGVLIFYIFSLSGTANGLDKNVISKTQTDAIELSKVWDLESFKKAVKLFQQNAEDWEKLDEPRQAAFCLNEAAKLAQIYADYETAFQLLKKAIKIETKYNLIEEEAISSSLFAFFSNENSNKINSQKYSERAKFLSEQINSPKAKAYSNFCKGIYEYYYGKIKAATDFFEQSETSARETQDIYIISQSLFYVGFAYIREGSQYLAVNKMNLALELCEKFNYQKGRALSYFGLAASYYFTEKQKALDYLAKSKSMFPENFEWIEKARILTTIGNIYMDLGEFDLAESNYQKAIPNYEKANYLVGEITTLTLLADIYIQKSDLEKAKQTYELALNLTIVTNDKFRIANIKEGLGNIEFKQNNFKSAIENYLEALKIYNHIGVKLTVIENFLGNSYCEIKEFEKAREYYISALKTNRQTKDSLQLSETLYNLSRLEVKENNSAEALKNITESVVLTENLYSDVANSNLKSSYLSSVFDRYELYIKFLMKSSNKNYAVQALQTAEKSRARSMLEALSLSESNFTKDADPEMLKREKEIRVLLNNKADKLTDLLSQKADQSETDEISNEINELKNQLEEIKADIKQNSPIYSTIKNPAPFDVGEFQKNVLDDDSLLLEFSFGDEESYLWLIGKTEFSSYVLPSREQLETNIQTLRELLASREMLKDESIEAYQNRIAKADEDYSKLAKDLSRDLFGQVEGKFGNKRLIIVPDGKLGYFPVSALPLPNSETGEPILLSNEVVYEPSASTLSLLTNNKQKNPASKSLLIFSDPVFSADDSRLSGAKEDELSAQSETGENFRFVESLNSLVRLDSSKTEADSIIDILGTSNADNFSGFSANRERLLKTNTADYKILHFATHGLIDEKRPELSGILLSQFDENGKKTDEFFRLHDIYGMNLNADLVVLSACNTGIGKEVKGEGLMSLNNAFLSVGAKSVMASLWKVEDGATLDLMKNFYSAMANEKLTPSKALQQAQIKMWRSDRHKSPFYWAAFTVQGDYRNVPDISRGFDKQLYLLPFVLIIFLGVLWRYNIIRRRNCK